MKADAVVIGGGIIGSSILYYLTRAGKKVLLVEKNGIGEGTSGACDGFVIMQTKKVGLPLQMAMRSADIYQDLADELGYETQYRRRGGLILIENEEMHKVMEHVVEQQIRQGMEVEFLNNEQTRKMEPLVSSQIAGSVHCALDGEVSPIHTTRAYIKRSADLGAQILTHTEVTDILVSDGQVQKVVTSRGEIETNVVVNAAGVWSPFIGKMVGIDIPVRSRRGHLMVTEAVAPALQKVLLCARYIAIKHDPSLVEKATDDTFRLGVSLSMEQTVNGNFIIGSNREFAGYDTNTRFEVLRAISEYSTRFVPALRELNVIRTFVGMRPYCEDGMPIVGEVPGIAGMFLATGHEGDGVALAPITGQVAADMILGKEPEFDMSSFSFKRFMKEAK
ncbi:MAG: FAD-binding oxidoreductase [Clostridiales bacterium]|nr:FAD-binding oxidoreductase [Clostridiales bacterium]